MWLILLFVIIIGLCVGSFLNVVILRAISNESIIFPASKCPKCQHPLKWWHNIPVFSYIILRGKCGFCGEKISIQYPIIEILTSVIFALIFMKNGLTPETLYCWIIACLFIVLATTDWKKQVVYNKHLYALIGTGLIWATIATGIWLYYYFTSHDAQPLNQVLFFLPITKSVIGTIAGFVIMEIIARIGYLVAGDRAFGEGDSYIAAGIGAAFGWMLLIVTLILSVIVQTLITLPIFIKKEIQNKNWIALISLGIFTLYAVSFFMAQQFGWMTSNIAYIASSIVLFILGLLTCREVLVGLKNPENRTYLPFGPAMAIASLIVLLII